MGDARRRIEEAAEKAVRAKLDALGIQQNQTPNSARSFGCLNGDNTKIKFTDGFEAPVQVSGHPISRCGPVTDMGNGTYYMEGRKPDIISVGGGNSIWAVLGVYPSPSTTFVPPFGFVVSVFPVFNLISYTTLKQYRIPESMLPDVFDTTPHDSTQFPGDTQVYDLGYNANFFVALSPNGKTLAIVRTRIQRIGTGAVPLTIDHTLWVSWNVISNFTLDNENGTITGGTVVGGTRSYPHNTAVTNYIPPVTPPSFVNFTFVEWRRVTIDNSVGADPIFWWDTDGTTHIDLLGRHESSVSGVAIYTNGVQTFSLGSWDQSQGGLVLINDLTVSGNRTSTGAAGMLAKYQISFTNSGSVVILEDTGYTSTAINTIAGGSGQVLVANADGFRQQSIFPFPGQFGHKYRSLSGSGAAGFKTSLVSSGTGFNDIPSNFYFFSPYLTISSEVPYANSFSTNYIGDETRMYPDSNDTTGWLSIYNMASPSPGFIKTTGTGIFQELKLNADLTCDKVQKWQFDTNPQSATFNRMTKSGEIKARTSDAAIVVLGSGNTVYQNNSPNSIVVMDFISRSS